MYHGRSRPPTEESAVGRLRRGTNGRGHGVRWEEVDGDLEEDEALRESANITDV